MPFGRIWFVVCHDKFLKNPRGEKIPRIFWGRYMKPKVVFGISSMVMFTSTWYTYTFGPFSNPTWSIPTTATVVA